MNTPRLAFLDLTPHAAGPLLALAPLLLAGCGDSSDDSGFVLRTTTHSAEITSELDVVGLLLVYLADETSLGPAGTDLNGDGDILDDVAVAVNMSSTVETVLGVAAESAEIVGSEVYLAVDESEDGVDWNGANGLGDVVLLHWSSAAGAVTFVDVLDGGSHRLASAGTRLYYSSGVPLGLVDETSLRLIETSQPTMPVAVLNEAGGGLLEVEVLGEDAGLLFLALDETSGGGDRNGDLDAADEHVLALLDGTDAAARVMNVELALPDDSSPFDAFATGTGDWLAAFLVNETFQGTTNLNDQTLFTQPLLTEACGATPDVDLLDDVLFYLDFSDFLAGTPPVNTGLAGKERVIAFSGFVATTSDELDANCDLNADGDLADTVARWVATTLPVAPAREAVQMHALATGIPGGSMGLARLDARLIAIVSEADDEQNLDGKLAEHELVGWLDPASGVAATWDFSHQSASTASFGTGVFDSDGDSEPFAGTSWMAAEPVGDRLAVTFLEEVPGTNPDVGSLNTNLDCNFLAKDTDKTDALPVWADFESGPTLDWDGVGYAVDPANAGIVIAAGFAFFRVSEPQDERDYNDDGDELDVVLFRNPLTTCGPIPMATSTTLASPVIATDGLNGAAFLSSESQAGLDFNGDGDLGDLVPRYFLF